jgi:hypothetical protein
MRRPAARCGTHRPSIPERAVYFGTGDATTAPPARRRTPSAAVDLDTGKLLWSYQATENDVFMGGCNGPDKSAPLDPMGPDMDIGNSPMLRTLPNGKRVLTAGTKSADLRLDPDDNGKLFTDPSLGLPLNGNGRGRVDRARRGPTIVSRTTASAPRDSRQCSRARASACGFSHLHSRPAPAAAAAHRLVRRRRPFPASCCRGRRMASCTLSRRLTASSCGSTKRRRNLKRSTACRPTVARSARRAP